MTQSELVATLAQEQGLSKAQVSNLLNDYVDMLKADLISPGLTVVHGIDRLKSLSAHHALAETLLQAKRFVSMPLKW